MIAMISRKFGWMAIGLSIVLAGCSSTPTKDETNATLSAAETTLKNFRNDPELTWFRENAPKAKAILVSPQIWQAGFVVGGSTGKAIVMARDGGKTWVGPAFYRVSAGSLGLQAGAQTVEMVALVMTDKAMNSLMSSSFKLGGDLSYSVGPVGLGKGAPFNTDLVVYTRTKGLYGGINIDGTAITTSDDDNKVYYGKPVTPVDILIKKSVADPGAGSLAKTLSGISP